MAIRQYIGARYVPAFKGVYDNTQSYEALDVVDNGSGTSYIAKKPTPANTPLTDTNYWFLYGSTNGAIINLQNQINVINSIIDDLENNALNTNFKNRKIVFLGDSYNFSDGGWLTKLVAKLGISASQYYDYTVTGHSFRSDSWLGDLTTFVTDHPDVRNEITDIIIVGGFNDSNSSVIPTLATDIQSFLSYVEATLPNAFISVAFVGASTSQASTNPAYSYDRRMECLNVYKASLNTDISRLLPGTYNSLYAADLFVSDGYHPNSAGNDSIVNSIAQALLSGSCDIINKDVKSSAGTIYNSYSETLNDVSRVFIDGLKVPANTTIPKSGDTPESFTMSMPSGVRITNTPKIESTIVDTAGRYSVIVWIENGLLNIQSNELNQYGQYVAITLAASGGYIVCLNFIKATNDV